MLTITIPGGEKYNDETGEFLYTKDQTIVIEHSLVSISKWESKWLKPFLDKKQKTYEESIDYIRCMTLTQNVDPNSYYGITSELFIKINSYIESPCTATWFSDRKGPPNREIVTSELIYYWMISLGIPFECQKWHLNRLLTLIKVCNEKNAPKKMAKNDIRKRNASLNAARRAALHSKG